MLLPVYFGVREPQRVCRSCSVTLEPMQTSLASSISNSTRDTEFDPDDVGKYMLNPLSFSMSAEIKKACHSIENFFGHSPNSTIQDQYIPAVLLKQAKGLAFLTVIKAGMVFTGRIGTGIVVAKDAEGNWTAPSAIGIGGLGWGFQIGGEVSDFVIILNTDSAVDAFSGKAQVSLGSQLGISVGPVGRTGEATMNIGDGGLAPCYSYSQSKGLFAGISLEGAVISERTSINHNFYGLKCEGKDLLAGKYPPPKAAAPCKYLLYLLLNVSKTSIVYNALRTALNKDPGSLLGSNNNNQI